MSHFAKIEDGIVTQVIVAEQDFIDTYHSDETRVQTSYNTREGKHYEPQNGEQDYSVESADQNKALRKNFAGVGMIYDATRDAFYLPQPHASWSLNETTCIWESPISYPVERTGEDRYQWNEDAYQADNTQGWEEI